MSTLFAKLKDWLPGQAKQVAGVSVTYTRGATTRTITALEGRTAFAAQPVEGPRIEFGDRDYLILATDLAALGEPVLGDRISQAFAGQTEVYEVITPGTGDPAWRWSDPGHTIYRLHTKRVS